MKEEIKKIKPEVISEQKNAVIKELAVLELQAVFIEDDLETKIKEAKKEKDKELRETMLENLNKQKLQQVHPMRDNIAYKSRYYEYLSAL